MFFTGSRSLAPLEAAMILIALFLLLPVLTVLLIRSV